MWRLLQQQKTFVVILSFGKHCAILGSGDLCFVIRVIAVKALWGLGSKNSLLAREWEKVPWRWCDRAESERTRNGFYRQRGWGGGFEVGEMARVKIGRHLAGMNLYRERWSCIL